VNKFSVEWVNEINDYLEVAFFVLLILIGLESDHAYSILDARQVNSQRLVRLRNPWGEKEWKGALSENWTKWPKTLKSKLITSSANDGVFWMRMYFIF